MPARNSQDEDQPGIDQPDSQGEQPGFDLGWAPVYHARIAGPIEDARKFADRSRGVIVDRLVNALAGPAAYADHLRGKMVAPIVKPLQEAAQYADDLSSRLLSPIVQTISDAAGWGRKFGVWPDMGDGSHLPVDVLEARALAGVPALPVPVAPDGLPWVLTPAEFADLQERYRVEVLPLFGVDTPTYTQKREELEARIPPGSSWQTPWREFTLQALATAPVVPLSSTPFNFTSSPNIPSPTGGTSGVSSPPGSPVSGPVLNPGQVVRVGDPSQAPPGFITNPFHPGFAFPPDWQNPACPGELKFPNPPGVADGGGKFWVSFGSWPNVRWCEYLGNPPVGCGSGAITTAIMNSGGQTGRCVDMNGKPIETGSTPIPTIPETPPGMPVPCVKICGFEDLLKALKPTPTTAECPKYKAWRDSASGECYVQPSAQEPRHSDDKFLTESSNPATIVEAVNRECGKKPERKPEQPLAPALGIGQGPTKCDWILPPINADVANWENPLAWLIGLVDQQGNPKAIDTSSIGSVVVSALLRVLGGNITTVTDNVWKVLRGFLAGDPCFGGANLQNGLTIELLNVLRSWIGIDLEMARIPLQQQQRFNCPLEMPGPVDAARAYLGNTIDEATARCWIRAAGMRDTLYDRVIRASRSTLNAEQVVRLARRKAIPEGTLAERLRELGFLDQRDYEELWELGRALPGPADIVRFMVRDVDDGNLVGRFGLDDEFGQKFAGLTAEYAEAAGVDPDLMKRFWRAHWSIPSPSQLLEMFHRLRNRDPGDPLRVELDDIRTALRQNDVLPYWVDKLLAVSFRPLRQVDVRRAYFDGSIDLAEVRRAYVDYGYSDENADILTRHQQKQKRVAAGNHSTVTAYSMGQINGTELAFEMQADGFEPDEIEYALAKARNKMVRRRRTSCGASYKRRMIRRELDAGQVVQKLIDLGLDGDQSQVLADSWACETAARGKEFSAAQLCKLYERGLITAPEMVRRLEVSGWTRDDAIRIYSVCSQDVDAKRKAEQIKALRQQEAEAEKNARKLEKERAKTEAALAKQGREEDRIARLNDARNRGIIEAGQAWSSRLGLDLSDSITLAKSVYRTVRDNSIAGQATLLRAVLTSSKSKGIDTPAAWVSEALTIATSGTFPDPNNPPVD